MSAASLLLQPADMLYYKPVFAVVEMPVKIVKKKNTSCWNALLLLGADMLYYTPVFAVVELPVTIVAAYGLK